MNHNITTEKAFRPLPYEVRDKKHFEDEVTRSMLQGVIFERNPDEVQELEFDLQHYAQVVVMAESRQSTKLSTQVSLSRERLLSGRYSQGLLLLALTATHTQPIVREVAGELIQSYDSSNLWRLQMARRVAHLLGHDSDRSVAESGMSAVRTLLTKHERVARLPEGLFSSTPAVEQDSPEEQGGYDEWRAVLSERKYTQRAS